MLLRLGLLALAAASTLSAQTTTRTIAIPHPQQGNPDILIRAVQTLTSCPGVGETQFTIAVPPLPPLLIVATQVPVLTAPALLFVSLPTATRIPLIDFGISAGPGCDLGVDLNSLIVASGIGSADLGTLAITLEVIRGVRVLFPLGLSIQLQSSVVAFDGSLVTTNPVQLTRTQ